MNKKLEDHVKSMEYYTSEARGHYIDLILKSEGYDVKKQKIDDSLVSTSHYNYIVTLPGLEKNKIVIGAHYDKFQLKGYEPFPAADDNASGCAVLIELINKISKKKFKKTLDLVFFGSEEPYNVPEHLEYDTYEELEKIVKHHGGAKQYLNNNSPKDIFYMLNVDSIGQPDFRISDMDRHTKIKVPEFLVSIVKNAADELGIKMHIGMSGGGSDYSEFLRKDIPAAILATNEVDYLETYMHSHYDTSDRINYKHIAKAIPLLDRVIELLDV